jgi:hypothetical protein
MISLKTKVTTNSVPNSYIPPDDMQGVLQAIPQFTNYSLDDNGADVTINATGGRDLNGLWVWMLNQYKLPPRLMTGYRGGWWQLYTGKPGEIQCLMGYPSGYFDGSGRGIEYSGWEGWQLCNGQNGSPDLHSFFVVPGYRFDGAGWITNIAGYDAYGNPGGRTFQIFVYNFPIVSVWINSTDFFKRTNAGVGGLWSVWQPTIPTDSHSAAWYYYLDNWQQMQQIPISRIPPYIALGYAMFIGFL